MIMKNKRKKQIVAQLLHLRLKRKLLKSYPQPIKIFWETPLSSLNAPQLFNKAPIEKQMKKVRASIQKRMRL